VQLFWGEPLAGIAERVERLRGLSESRGRAHPPLEFGLRITTLVRETSDEAWRDAEARVAALAAVAADGQSWRGYGHSRAATGQRRLLELAERGEVLDVCLYTAPGRYGAEGAGSTWLVGSYDEVAAALARYADLGVTHFVLSDTPYEEEIVRVGDHVLPRLRDALGKDGPRFPA
jgi:alkanesulfonate monooxygenase